MVQARVVVAGLKLKHRQQKAAGDNRSSVLTAVTSTGARPGRLAAAPKLFGAAGIRFDFGHEQIGSLMTTIRTELDKLSP